MKNNRQNEILDIIKLFNIETQEELIIKLRERGYDVTQATVSRDIRELKLVKITSGDNSYKYAAPTGDDKRDYNSKYKYIIRETVTDVDYACNLVILKTMPGMAQASAAAIDGLGWNELVGSIAGDDTVFIAMRSEKKASEYAEQFKNIINLV
ncbi:MAG: arginine repressor [Ruminococcaceae bacterium]|nr:arginine repressor [Oscillospiraceae bacterium]